MSDDIAGYVVTFQRKDPEAAPFTLMYYKGSLEIERTRTTSEIIEAAVHGVSHARLERHLSSKLGLPHNPLDDDDNDAGEAYPNDLNLDPATITCRAVTEEENFNADAWIG